MGQVAERIRQVGVALLLGAGCAAEDVRIVEGPYVEVAGAGRTVVNWRTELPGDSWVDYGPTPDHGVRIGSKDTTRIHAVPLLDLRAGRPYFYRVSSAGSSREGRFTAGLAFVRGPYSQAVTPSGAVLMWETEPALEARVAYRAPDTPADTVDAGGPGAGEALLSGLRPGTRYRCRVLAGGMSSPEVRFRTPSPSDTAFSFLLYGDSRGNPDVHGKLVRRMAEERFDFVLHSGDFVDDGRVEAEWAPQFFEPVRPIALMAPIYPALGNHEYDAPAYYRYFTVPDNGSSSRPEAWYAFDYGNARFLVLDSNPVSGMLAPGTEQRRWLERELEASDAQWKFAVFHHPVYSSGRHKSNLELRRALVPIFERYGVDMVLTGHDHLYERTFPLRGGTRHDDGIVQVVSGGGGAELYAAGRSEWTAVSESRTHYCTIRISGSRLDFDAFDVAGERLDAWTLLKDRAVLDRLLAAAGGERPEARLEAVVDLGRTGRLEAAPVLVPLAASGEVGLRRAVAEALARIASPAGFEALLGLTGDADTAVRRWAMRGVIDLGGPRAAEACLAGLADADWQVRRTAARGLQRTPLSEAVPALVEAGRDGDASVRLEAVRALAALQGSAAGEGLIAALDDSDGEVRRAAFEGVVEKGLEALAVRELVGLLEREDASLRREVLRALSRTGDRRALPALVERLKDPDRGVRQVAAMGVAQMGDASAAEALIAALDDPDAGVRTYAMRALRMVTGEFPGPGVEAWKRWWQQRAPAVP